MQYFVLHTCDFFSIWYISPFPETPNIPLKKFYFYYGFWLSLFSFTKTTLPSGCLWHILKRQVVLYRKMSHDLKYYSMNLSFYFVILTKLKFTTLTKKICFLEKSRTELKGIRNTVFCIFFKGIRNTVFCIFYLFFSTSEHEITYFFFYKEHKNSLFS